MNKYIKLVIAGLMVAGGIFLMFNRQIGWGIVCVVLSIVPIVLFFKNEYILLSLWKMRDQKLMRLLGCFLISQIIKLSCTGANMDTITICWGLHMLKTH